MSKGVKSEKGVNGAKGNKQNINPQITPIDAGKNVVHVEVRNQSSNDQVCLVYIYSLTGRAGWGRDYFETIEAGKSRTLRYAYSIRNTIGRGDFIRLLFYNPGPSDGPDYTKWVGKHGDEWFKNSKYPFDTLTRRPADTETLTPAAESDRAAALKTFESFQKWMQAGEYAKAWSLCSRDYLMAQQIDLYLAYPAAAEKSSPDYYMQWNLDELIAVQPQSVWAKGNGLRLKGQQDNRIWMIDYVREGDDWKIDWFSGFGPKVNPLERAITRMKKRSTKHYDIFYFPDTTAAKDIDQIAEVREKGIQAIIAFMGKEPQVRLRLILFEDAETKYRQTWHQGAGFARGNTLGEIYNATEKMDPYHETAHILMSAIGSPPAWLNEGFAVYIVERMGSSAIRGYGGGEKTIRQYARELNDRGDWIVPKELMAFMEIGPDGTRPQIAYPEAASLVQYVIDTYGKDTFFKVYGTLGNSSDTAVRDDNRKQLETICGKSLDVFLQEWDNFLSTAAVGP